MKAQRGVVACLLSLSSMSLGEEPAHSRDVLRESNQAVRFIPEGLIHENGTMGLPVPETSLRDLRRQLLAAPAERACIRAPLIEGIGSGSGATGPMQLADLIAKNEAAVLGKVVRIVPGWLVRGGYVVSLIHVSVTERLKDGIHGQDLRDTVTYAQASGSMKVGKSTLCTLDSGGYPAVEIGDPVLVIGFLDRVNPGNILTNGEFVFLTRDGVVQTETSRLVVHRPVPLREIRRPTRLP